MPTYPEHLRHTPDLLTLRWPPYRQAGNSSQAPVAPRPGADGGALRGGVQGPPVLPGQAGGLPFAGFPAGRSSAPLLAPAKPGGGEGPSGTRLPRLRERQVTFCQDSNQRPTQSREVKEGVTGS